MPAGPVTVTLANHSDLAVELKINGQVVQLAPGEQVPGASIVPAPSGNDVIQLHVIAKPSCGTGDADDYFQSGGAFRVTVSNGPAGACGPDLPHSVTFDVSSA